MLPETKHEKTTEIMTKIRIIASRNRRLFFVEFSDAIIDVDSLHVLM